MVEHIAHFWIFYLVVLVTSLLSALVLAFRVRTIKHRYHLMVTGRLSEEQFLQEIGWLTRYKPYVKNGVSSAGESKETNVPQERGDSIP
ncbi:MAG: hypothetical protein QGH40_12240 [bacterium]|jgi:hypothetical protein|nr:hypothetical protein [bacterium]